MAMICDPGLYVGHCGRPGVGAARNGGLSCISGVKTPAPPPVCSLRSRLADRRVSVGVFFVIVVIDGDDYFDALFCEKRRYPRMAINF
jgi:hypothetical protein